MDKKLLDILICPKTKGPLTYDKKMVIPAAGKGTRMLDLAKDRPKHLIDVLDRPFLYYVLENLQEAGFEEMILVMGHHAERMVEFAKNDPTNVARYLFNQEELCLETRHD